ncbi:MAG: hypothetical protein EXR71_18005 [Myxococcales bacterium]|nr:hypothetical protein [Myxococcales bacterium]
MTEFWSGLDASRRKVLVVAVGASLAAVVGVGVWASQPSWSKLNRVYDNDNRTVILDQLSAAGVDWRLGSDGQTIEVPALDLATAKKATAGNPASQGLEGVTDVPAWSTPWAEKVYLQKMLAGELVKQINGIRGIAASSVLVNLDQGTGFLGDQARPSAAVSIKTDAGTTATRDLGKTIAKLVADGLPGMTDADVTVVDQNTGRAIWSGEAVEDRAAAPDEAERRAGRMQKAVTEALAAVLGTPAAVSVIVQLDVDGSSSESTVNAVDPDSVAAIREKAESDQNSGTTTGAQAGEAGVQSNTPSVATPSNAGTARKREQTDTQYQVSTTKTTTVKPAGALKRISAGVMIDLATVQAIATASKMDEKELRASLEAVAQTALGFDAKRGDAVNVAFLPFAETALSEATTAQGVPWTSLVPAAVALVAVLLTFLMVVRPLLKALQLRGVSSVAPQHGFETVETTGPDGSPILVTRVAGAAARGAAAYGQHAQVGDEDEDTLMDLGERLRKQVEGYRHVSAQDLSALVVRESNHSAEVLRRWIRD